MNFLVIFLPLLNKRYANSAEFQKLQAMNLKGRLSAKLKAHEERKKTSVLTAALNMADVYVFSDNKNLGLLIEMEEEDAMDLVFEEKEVGNKMELVARKGIEFYTAKDMRP